jgi:hypothetical protein
MQLHWRAGLQPMIIELHECDSRHIGHGNSGPSPDQHSIFAPLTLMADNGTLGRMKRLIALPTCSSAATKEEEAKTSGNQVPRHVELKDVNLTDDGLALLFQASGSAENKTVQDFAEAREDQM